MNTEPENPYAPPETAIAAAESGIDLNEYADASQGKRFINLLVDRAATYGLTIVVGFGIGMLYQAGVQGPYEMLLETGAVGDYASAYLLALFYYVVMEGLFGLTLGKLITGTRVVNEMGKKPSWGAIIGRSFARIVPFEPFSFLGGNRGWHDQWSGTRVVDIRNRAGKIAPSLRNIYDKRY